MPRKKKPKFIHTHMESRSCAATMDRSPTHLPWFRETTLRAIPVRDTWSESPPIQQVHEEKAISKRKQGNNPLTIAIVASYTYYLGWSSKNPKWMHQNHDLPHAPWSFLGQAFCGSWWIHMAPYVPFSWRNRRSNGTDVSHVTQLGTRLLCASKNRDAPNGWLIMENHIKMDDLGVPLFSETPI